MSRLLHRLLFQPLGLAAYKECAGAWRAASRPAGLLPTHSATVASRRLAGHSRWQNVRNDKEAGAAQKRALVATYQRMVRKAIIDGNGSTSLQANVHLKAVFDKAKTDNVPMKTLERVLALKSAEGTDSYAIEIRGRGGICMLVISNSVHRIKCKQEVSSHAKRIGLEVAGIDSSVTKSFFEKKGCVEVQHDPVKLANLDRATELALEFDCADVRFDIGDSTDDAGGGTFVFDCAPSAVNTVAQGLRSAGLSVLDASVRYEPFERVEVDNDTLEVLGELVDKLRDNVEGVEQVFDNVSPIGGGSA